MKTNLTRRDKLLKNSFANNFSSLDHQEFFFSILLLILTTTSLEKRACVKSLKRFFFCVSLHRRPWFYLLLFPLTRRLGLLRNTKKKVYAHVLMKEFFVIFQIFILSGFFSISSFFNSSFGDPVIKMKRKKQKKSFTWKLIQDLASHSFCCCCCCCRLEFLLLFCGNSPRKKNFLFVVWDLSRRHSNGNIPGVQKYFWNFLKPSHRPDASFYWTFRSLSYQANENVFASLCRNFLWNVVSHSSIIQHGCGRLWRPIASPFKEGWHVFLLAFLININFVKSVKIQISWTREANQDKESPAGACNGDHRTTFHWHFHHLIEMKFLKTCKDFFS